MIKKAEPGRVSFTPAENFLVGNENWAMMSATREDRVNALGALLHNGMKRMLKRVVEVQYTTGMEVAG